MAGDKIQPKKKLALVKGSWFALGITGVWLADQPLPL